MFMSMGSSCCGSDDYVSECEVMESEGPGAMIAFYVEDVSKTIEFYKKVFGGFLMFSDPEGDFASMKVHGLHLGFIKEASIQKQYDKFIPNRMGTEKSAGMELIFPVDDAVAYYNDTVAKAQAAGYNIGMVSPAMQSWGAVCGWVSDNNGIMISITGRMGCC